MKKKQNNLKKNVFFLAVSSLSFLFFSCAVDPDGAGSCSLSCSTTKIPSNDMRIRFLLADGETNSQSLSLSCSESLDGNLVNEVPIRFVIEKPRHTLPAEQTVGADDPVLGGSAPEDLEASQWVPVSGLAFEPMLVSGSMSAVNDTNPVLDRYKGVLTADNEWCTDSCGVGSLDIKPQCFAGSDNNVVLGIISGSLFSTISVNVSGAGE